MSAVTPADAPVKQTGRWWTIAKWTIFTASALGCIFEFPQFVAVPPAISPSYIFGYSNRTGVLLLLGFLIICGVLSKEFGIKFRPPAKSGRIPGHIFWTWMAAFAAAGIAMCFLTRGLHGFDESRYLIDRVKQLALGKTPFRDFEFAYGALFLYGPRLLMLLHLTAEQSYFAFWLLCLLGGVWLLHQTLEMLDYPSQHKVGIFHFFCLFGLIAVFCTGLNYTLWRFLPASYFGLLVQREDGLSGRRHRVMAMLMSVGFTAAVLMISPEMGLAYAAGSVGYFAVFGRWDKRSVAEYFGFLTLEVALLLIEDRIGALATLKAFSGGAFNFPIVPAGHILFLFFASSLVAIFVAGRLRERSRGDGTLMIVAVSVGTLMAALGRCDIGHVGFSAIGILIVATTLASNFPRIWDGYRIAFIVLFVLIPTVLELSKVPYTLTKRRALINRAAVLKECQLPSSPYGPALAPFGFSPTCERELGSGLIDPGYFYGMENVLTPPAVDRKINEIRNRPKLSLLLPDDFDAKCKVNVEAQRQLIRVLFAYPYQGQARNAPDVAEPLCTYIHAHYSKAESLGRDSQDYAIWNPLNNTIR